MTVGAVTYELSQPWPFPSQLMIGVRCEALTEEITPDAQELEDARWVSRADAAAMLAREHPEGLIAPAAERDRASFAVAVRPRIIQGLATGLSRGKLRV